MATIELYAENSYLKEYSAVIHLLPTSLNEIRIVQINDIDEQACGGTHVNNTNEIKDFSIMKIQQKGPKKKRIKIQLLD
ncbi:hypothetical protein E2R55_16600 [Vibrio vulnificus]|nr:hypothetical protein E2R55_16600 [Vibrio vulnificus]